MGNVLVVGLGYRTGVAVSNLLISKGYDVTVSDLRNEVELKNEIKALDERVVVESSNQTIELLNNNYEFIVLSPGVPTKIPLIVEAKKRDIKVISEIEFASRYLKGDVIAITGTDGKSTTTTLTGFVLEKLGFEVFTAGNIGIPLASVVERSTENSVTVLELSSYQLETIDKFRPDIAAILNVSPDHLDRYENMEKYFEAKLRISENQSENDSIIYNLDDKVVKAGVEKLKANKTSFSVKDGNADIYCNNKNVCHKDYGEMANPKKMKMPGLHNVKNGMASALMIIAFLKRREQELDLKKIAEAIYLFPGLEHRMEIVGVYKTRIFYNDSKATTVAAVQVAIKSLPTRGILIIGGQTKGDDYSRLKEVIRGKIKGIVAIGESAEYFYKLFTDLRCIKAESMEDAVLKALDFSDEKDSILLSPACASFDMFSSYEERGKVFKSCYEKLKNEEIVWTSNQS